MCLETRGKKYWKLSQNDYLIYLQRWSLSRCELFLSIHQLPRASQPLSKRHLTCKWFPSSAIVEKIPFSAFLTRLPNPLKFKYSRVLSRLSWIQSLEENFFFSRRKKDWHEKSLNPKPYVNSNWGWSFHHNCRSDITTTTPPHSEVSEIRQ